MQLRLGLKRVKYESRRDQSQRDKSGYDHQREAPVFRMCSAWHC